MSPVDADQEPVSKHFDESLVGPRAGRAGARRQLDAGHQADIADVDDVRARPCSECTASSQ